LGVPAATIVERLGSFEPVFGRCSAHVIENGPVLIADTAKAPYHSIYLPINMMAEFIAPRRRIVIGKIGDYAGNPYPKYRDVYRAARLVADQVIFAGDDTHRSQAPPEDIASGRFVAIPNIEETAEFLRKTAIPGEIILVKSSGYLHLERLILNFDSPVRCWVHTCGKRKDCLTCGSYAVPFEHGKEKRLRGNWGRPDPEPASPNSATPTV
jgi:UDP-N-acetylmuramoyl-tripeptide--D-alanyl-D-alanine ligase